MKVVKNKNKFRIGFEERKQIFSYYTVKPASRKDIGSNEIDTFSEYETNNETTSDSENELDWTKIKKQQEKRMVLENERKEKVVETGNYVKINHFDFKVDQILNYENFKLKQEKWLQNNLLHCEDDLPAYITYYENGNKQEESWFKNGDRHREGDLPAVICYYENGNKQKECWCKNNELHREGDLPAMIWYFENENKQSKSWCKNGILNREDDLPAVIHYFENGNKQEEKWFENCRLYRENDCLLRLVILKTEIKKKNTGLKTIKYIAKAIYQP